MLGIAFGFADEPPATDLFVGGQGGYHTYRIPATAVTAKGTVLVFCEGRKNDHEDTGDIDLLLRRSEDGGKTWTDAQVVHEVGGDAEITIGNPVPIVDRANDRVHLLMTRDYKRVFHLTSDDDGKTWSEPREITSAFDGFDYDRAILATGPVHGIQTRDGRLVAPVWLSDRERGERYRDDFKGRIRAGVIFSEDGGQTWKAGGLVPATLNRLHEGTIEERESGELVLNMRMRASGLRAVATSDDGGRTWNEPALDRDLPCPTCQASMIKLRGGRWLFLNPAVSGPEVHSSRRRNLTLRTSPDEGRTWTDSRVIRAGPSGYSDMAVLPNGIVLCVFENGEANYREKISIVELSVQP